MPEPQQTPATEATKKEYIPEPVGKGDVRRFIGWSSDAKNAEYSFGKFVELAKGTTWLWWPIFGTIGGYVTTSGVAVVSLLATIVYHTIDLVPAILLTGFMPLLHYRLTSGTRKTNTTDFLWELASWAFFVFPLLWLIALMMFGYAIHSSGQTESVPFVRFWLIAFIYGGLMAIIQIFWLMAVASIVMLASFQSTLAISDLFTRKPKEPSAESTEKASTSVTS